MLQTLTLRRALGAAALSLIGLAAGAQIAITEIMYNPPEGGTDSLEFIELHNTSTAAIDLGGYILAFSSSADTLSGTLAPGGFYVSAVNARAFATVFGRQPDSEWTGSGLSNGGNREISVTDAVGATVVAVTYDDEGDWPSGNQAGGPDGGGASIKLCDLSADPNDGSNWEASTTSTGVTINGFEVLASPYALPDCAGGGGGNTEPYRVSTVAEVTGVDGDGALDSIGARVELRLLVISPDFNEAATSASFFGIDATGGINVFDASGYEPEVGDRILVRGTIEQRSGTARIAADEILTDGTMAVPPPQTTSVINEALQGQLVRIEDVTVVDPSDWQTGGSFNIGVTNGTDTFAVRIWEATDIVGQNYPTGTFDLTGVAWQFDTQAPFDEGYQLFPRFAADIEPFIPGSGPSYAPTSIAEIRAVDADGAAQLLDRLVATGGVVVSPNFRPGGLQFTIVDENGLGIGIFSGGEDFDYVPFPGDSVLVTGEVSQFFGLTQVTIDDLSFRSSGNPVPAPQRVDDLGEDTESRLVEVVGSFTDVSDWGSGGSGFNVTFVTEGGNEIQVRIDSDSELADNPAPSTGTGYRVVGVGGQFDNSSPFTEGYQLLPRYDVDITEVSSTRQVPFAQLARATPSPEGILLAAEVDLTRVRVLDATGRVVLAAGPSPAGTRTTLALPNRGVGVYLLRLEASDGARATVRVVR